ncbi:MAG: aspartyl protease [Nostocaceae cyanobacterium]|nr:aspartyl protease [Nostocaceae cyanobacterium]
MILGEFNSRGELLFEIGLLSADGDVIPVQAILDTGFTGWLAIDKQDALSLGWRVESTNRDMQTAQGEVEFKLYEGNVLLDEQQFTIEVLGGEELDSILLGVNWLQIKRLVAVPTGVLTLG